MLFVSILPSKSASTAPMKFTGWPAKCVRSNALCLPLVLYRFAVAASATEPSGPATGGERGEPTWAEFVEADFPFFSSVLDARTTGLGLPADNLTPRGIILNLGHECWACFDTDLLRMSAIWSGKG